MNPYKVLNIDRNASKQEILKAVTLAMRERQYTSKEIAVAQKKLMDTVSRGAEEFTAFIDIAPFLKNLPKTGDGSLPEISVSNADLVYLPISEKSA